MFDYEYQSINQGQGATNMQKYGCSTPPLYPVDSIKDLPILLIGGSTDRMCQPGDYLALRDHLKAKSCLVELIET